MKSLGSKKLGFGLKSAFLLSALMLFAPCRANAGDPSTIVTPQQYCASLGSPSCEILNVENGGTVGANSTEWQMTSNIVKYCRNGNFNNADVFGEVGTQSQENRYNTIIPLGSANLQIPNLTTSVLCANLP